MAKAKRVKERTDWVNARPEREAQSRALAKGWDKPFEELSGAEKDDLLKTIAIRLGLVKAA